MSTKVVPIRPSTLKDASVFSDQVVSEYIRARHNFGPFNNGHEGYAVLLEEVEELWEEVKHPTTYTHFREECIQVAAMAMAMAIEAGND